MVTAFQQVSMIPFVMKQCLKHGPRYMHHFCTLRMCKAQHISLPEGMVSATFQEVKMLFACTTTCAILRDNVKMATWQKKNCANSELQRKPAKCFAFGDAFLVNRFTAEKRENHHLVGKKCEMCNRKYARTTVRNQCGSQKKKVKKKILFFEGSLNRE